MMSKILRCPALLLRRQNKLGPSLGRHRTRDVAFTFRMGAGFPGEVNRGHPSSILPNLIDVNAAPQLYGIPVVVDPTTQGVRPIVAGDSALTFVWGVTVRPFPFQQATATNYGATGFGGAVPPLLQPIDVLTGGYIMVSVVGAPIKGGPVWIWYAVSSGQHVQGGFEAANTGGSTLALDPERYQWNSPADGTGVAELKINF